MFEGFRREFITVPDTVAGTGDITIHALVGGPEETDSSPLLLLHGFPQHHLMWRHIAGALAGAHPVVVTDLRGYGYSSKPEGDTRHLAYSKRALAADQRQVMALLGFHSFVCIGHDRGGRVAHRLALDHPEVLEALILLDIVPTATMWARMTAEIAQLYWHWSFLIQPNRLPEHMIGRDPEAFLRAKLGITPETPRTDVFPDEVFEAYLSCLAQAECIHAMCEDYRAAATIDLEHDRADGVDRADRVSPAWTGALDDGADLPEAGGAEAGQDDQGRIDCPLHVLWARHNRVVDSLNPLACWRPQATDPDAVTGLGLDCGHYMAEEAPEAVLRALTDVLSG